MWARVPRSAVGDCRVSKGRGQRAHWVSAAHGGAWPDPSSGLSTCSPAGRHEPSLGGALHKVTPSPGVTHLHWLVEEGWRSPSPLISTEASSLQMAAHVQGALMWTAGASVAARGQPASPLPSPLALPSWVCSQQPVCSSQSADLPGNPAEGVTLGQVHCPIKVPAIILPVQLAKQCTRVFQDKSLPKSLRVTSLYAWGTLSKVQIIWTITNLYYYLKTPRLPLSVHTAIVFTSMCLFFSYSNLKEVKQT